MPRSAGTRAAPVDILPLFEQSETAAPDTKTEPNAGQELALDLRSNRLISASAGTGKTQTLIALYVGLLEGRLAPGGVYLSEKEWLRKSASGSVGMRPAEIVAVTFTEKAAAELKNRARDTLNERLKRTDLGSALSEHLRQCALELTSAPVSTIHAFCARLLRDAGAHSGAPAAFSVLEGDEADELLTNALSSVAGELLESGTQPELERLASAWNLFAPRSGLVDSSSRMLKQLRARGVLPDACNSQLEQAKMSLEEIREKLDSLYTAVPRAKNKGNSKPKAELLTACARRVLPDTLEEARLLALELGPHFEKSAFENFPWVDFNNLENPCAAIVSAAHGPYIRALQNYLQLALDRYSAAKRAADALDFDDLLLYCQALLLENARRPYRFILIDEFQDTNPLQKELLWRVAFGTQQPSSTEARLCVVGDVKQSIYRFRGADVSLMEDAHKTLKTSALSQNYRSRSAVLHFINDLCACMWRESSFEYSAGHVLEPSDSAARHVWEAPAAELLIWEKDAVGNAAEHRAQQAMAIARRILTLTQRKPGSSLIQPRIFDRQTKTLRDKVNFGDIAILANSLKNLRQPLQLAFTQLRIPFKILGGVSFYSRQEVIDALNLWSAAHNPGDAHAVSGLLRSPFVCLSDAGLWRFSEAWSDAQRQRGCFQPVSPGHGLLDGGFMQSLRREFYAPEDAAALDRASKLLMEISAMAGRRTAVEILDFALEQSGYLTVLAMQPRGEAAVAAVRKTIELARAFETQGNTQLSDLVRMLKQRADAEWDDPGRAGGPDLSDDLSLNADAVSIGTIHSAKGLEFPIVFLPELGAKTPNVSDAALISARHGFGLKLSAYAEGLPAVADQVHRLNAGLEKQEAEAESLRKLYVALTRARDYIVLLGEIPKSSDGPWRKLVDRFRLEQPAHITLVDARNPELKEVKAADSPGVLKFVNGRAEFPAEGAAACGTLPDLNAEERLLTEASAGQARTSVSYFAHWLWCPRQALFQSQETPPPAVVRRDHSMEEAGQEADEDTEFELPADSRALGTAAHAALEFLFSQGAALSDEVISRAQEVYLRSEGMIAGEPLVEETFQNVLRIARSTWGRNVLALPAAQRFTERPFRWRIGPVQTKKALTITGRMDLLLKRGASKWEVVDFKLSAVQGKLEENALNPSLARYAWQAGIYAQVAALILKIPVAQVTPGLAFLKDADCDPRSLETLGHTLPGAAVIHDAAAQFVSNASRCLPLELPAQRWMPQDISPQPRDAALCRSERCPYVARCFGPNA